MRLQILIIMEKIKSLLNLDVLLFLVFLGVTFNSCQPSYSEEEKQELKVKIEAIYQKKPASDLEEKYETIESEVKADVEKAIGSGKTFDVMMASMQTKMNAALKDYNDFFVNSIKEDQKLKAYFDNFEISGNKISLDEINFYNQQVKETLQKDLGAKID